MRKILSILILITWVSIPSFASSQHLTAKNNERGVGCGDLGIEVKDGQVSMNVKNAEITHVLKEIARKAEINFTIDEAVHGRISIKITSVTIEDALKKLCENRAIVFEYLPEKKSYRIISVGAYSGKKGSAVYNRAQKKRRDVNKASKPRGYDDERASGAGPKQAREKMYDSRGRLLYKPGELLVKFKQGVTEKQIMDLHKSLGSKVIGRMDRRRLQKIELRKGLSEQEAIDLYSASGLVEIAEMHALRYPNRTEPDDPLFSTQWGLEKIKAPEAWDITRGSPEIIIAVIDTGVDYYHPDLSDNIWINTTELNGVKDEDDDENGYVDDIYGWDFAGYDESDSNDQDADPVDVDGHGTHVAGIIAARGNNGQGVAGVCWNVKIMALKVQADNGEYMENWDVISAIDYAIENGARIVNCSFGGESYELSEDNAFTDLKDAGILAVCAAGNDSQNTDVLEFENYPSCYGLDNIISVAASDENDNLASFSNYGLTSVDIMAPGFSIKSTIPTDIYTEASVTVEADSSTIEYAALGMAYAGTTDEEGITALCYDCGPGNSSGDFPTQVNGNIAIIARDHVITFAQKTTNAQNAGAIAVIIYNDEPENFSGDLCPPPEGSDWVPVVSISKEDGLELVAMDPPLTVTLVNKPVNELYSYGLKQGTSMAAPYVSGVAGLILSMNPELNYSEVKSAILGNVDKIPSVSDEMVSGGRVNALCALCRINAIPGDLSCDNRVELDDAILALQVLSGLNPHICSACISLGIDVNGDGRIGIEEAIYVMQEVGGIER